MTDYDCTPDLLTHIGRVQVLLAEFAGGLIRRGAVHDESKFRPEEKDAYDRATPILKSLSYGTPEYAAAFEELIGPAMAHHYAANSHHPEHWPTGISGMDLFDLVEMFFDWKAASERRPDGDIGRSIDINRERFAIEPQLVEVFRNTTARLGWTSASHQERTARMMDVRKQTPFSIWIGFDPREVAAFEVARDTTRRHAGRIPIAGIVLDRMRRAGLYWRPTEIRDGRLFDTISDHPMATEFAISRFLTPHLARGGWALFEDCDMLVKGDLYALFLEIERRFADKAIVCVKHDHRPVATTKMDGQAQSRYSRKNWSSFCFFNCDHPANKALTIDLINEVPGRDLHNFVWLGDDGDDLIGELPVEWNWLAGHSDPAIEPKNIHYTDGIPLMPGYEDTPHAGEFIEALHDHAERQV